MFLKLKEEIKEGKTLLQFGFLKSAGRALGMLVPLVVAKFFSEELFGSYTLARMIPFFFMAFSIESFKVPFIVYGNEERMKSGKINKSLSVQCIFILFSMGLFLSMVLAIPGPIMSLTKITKVELFFIVLAFTGLVIKAFLSNLCMAMGQRIKDSRIDFVFGLLTISFVLIFYFAGVLNLSMVFFVYFIAGVLVLSIFIKSFDFKLFLPLVFDKQYFKDMFNFAKWMVFGSAAGHFINWVDLLVLRFYGISMGEIGGYGLGYQIFKGFMVLMSILPLYFLPFITEHINNPEKVRSYLYNKRPKIFILGLIPIILIFAAIPYIFNFIYQDSYQEAVTVIRILLVAVVLVLYNLFYYPIINALKKYRAYSIISIIHVLINVILNIILIPIYGLYGAAVATVIGYFFRVVMIEFYYRYKLRGILKI